MELQYLKVFYEVAKRGSVSGAAQILHVSQPSLSRSIQNLEGSLRQKLFLRQARGVVLTEKGQEVFERCHRIFQECAAIENPEPSAKVHLRLAASENICLHILPNLLVNQFKAGSEFSLDLLSGTADEIIKSVLNGESAAGYCYHPSKTPGLSSVSIATVEFWLVAHPKLLGPQPTTRDLRKLPMIGSTARKYTGPYAAKSLLTEAGLASAKVVYQCNSQEAQVALVEVGLGFSLVPWFLVRDKVKSKKLIRVPTAKPLRSALYRVTTSGITWRHEFIDIELKRALEA